LKWSNQALIKITNLLTASQGYAKFDNNPPSFSSHEDLETESERSDSYQAGTAHRIETYVLFSVTHIPAKFGLQNFHYT